MSNPTPSLPSLLLHPANIKKAGLVLLALLLLAYVVSPYIAAHQIRSGIITGDAAAIIRRVDFPSLRESVKSQLDAELARARTDSAIHGGNSLDLDAAVIANAFLGAAIEGYLTPSGIEQLLAERKAKDSFNGVKSHAGYRSPNRFALSIVDEDQNIELILHRRGGFNWKLAEISFQL